MSSPSKRVPNPVLEAIRKLTEKATRTAVSQLLSDLPVLFDEQGFLSFSENAEPEVYLRVFQRLYELSRTAVVILNFLLGDIWNYWGMQSETYMYRQQILTRIVGSDKEKRRKLSRRLSNLGWVASKWPPETRDYSGKYWLVYVKTSPESKWMAENGKIPLVPFTTVTAFNKENEADKVTLVLTTTDLSVEIIDKDTGELTQYQFNMKAINKSIRQLKAMVESAKEEAEKKQTIEEEMQMVEADRQYRDDE